MSAKTVPCKHCSRKFVDENAAWNHARHRHLHAKLGKRPQASSPTRMDAATAYELVDALDLPDGAHWAMLEELTGMEPADFAMLGDDL